MNKIISDILKMIREQTNLSEWKIADIRGKLSKASQDDLERLYDSYYRFGVQNINEIIIEQKSNGIGV